MCESGLYKRKEGSGVTVNTEQKVAECKRVSTMEEKNSGEEERSNLLLLDRASRATRGKRLSKLLDDEVQQDELFWGQDALKEEDEDDNYQEEAEIADEFDSDFDQDVSLSQTHSHRLVNSIQFY